LLLYIANSIPNARRKVGQSPITEKERHYAFPDLFENESIGPKKKAFDSFLGQKLLY
jgi:hypothetical protein